MVDMPASGEGVRISIITHTSYSSERDKHMSDVVPVNATIVRQEDYFGYNPDLDFRKLAAEATGAAAGFRLVAKESLLGIPHVIVGVTYREGFPRKGVVGDYVSVECVTADNETMNRYMVKAYQRANVESIWPNEPLIYNDSGTGIRRALTAMFHQLGVIDVGEPEVEGSAYDRAFQFWIEGADEAAAGITAVPYGTNQTQPFRYVVARGLRVSEYEFQGSPAETFYFG
jgi:hypothetical protein